VGRVFDNGRLLPDDAGSGGFRNLWLVASVMHRGYERRRHEPVRPHHGARPASTLAPLRTGPAQHLPVQQSPAQFAPTQSAPTGPPIATQVGGFFRDLRRNFRLSQPEVAGRLATRIDIIAALEAGDVRNLPPWPETCRIVRTYTGFVGLDPRPILRLIEILQTSAGRSPMPAQDYADEDESLLSAAVEGLRQAWHGPLGQAARILVAAAIPVALVVLLTQTSVLEAAVSRLPPPVARIVRGAQNYVIVQLAPVHDGMRWIDVPDPRSRRGDKLPMTAHLD
jgi:Helix-turn-helix domain